MVLRLERRLKLSPAAVPIGDGADSFDQDLTDATRVMGGPNSNFPKHYVGIHDQAAIQDRSNLLTYTPHNSMQRSPLSARFMT
ncbi:MAG: hypothetical protein AAGB51_01000 [Planctomycetota bacterium]